MNQWLHLVRPTARIDVSTLGYLNVRQCPLVNMLRIHEPRATDVEGGDEEANVEEADDDAVAELELQPHLAVAFRRNP